MNPYFLIALFALPACTIANDCPDIADDKDVVVMFGNGMFNDESGAQSGARALVARVLSQIKDQSAIDRIDFGYSYNHNEEFHLQIMEVAKQKRLAQLNSLMQWLTGLNVTLSEEHQNFIRNLPEFMSYSPAADDDLKEHVSCYSKQIENEKCVVLVAHSQGNFYANLSYDSVVSSFRVDDQMQVISVGTPDNRVAGGGSWTTLDEDWIIDNFVGTLFPVGTLASNISNCQLDSCSTPWNCGTTLCNPGDPSGHQFIASYLNGINSKVRINRHLEEAITKAIDSCGKKEPESPVSDTPDGATNSGFRITKIEHEPSLTYTNDAVGSIGTQLKIYWEADSEFFDTKRSVSLYGCPVVCDQIECVDPSQLFATCANVFSSNSPNPVIHSSAFVCGKTFTRDGPQSGTTQHSGELIAIDSDNIEQSRIDVNFTCNVGGG
jgi:hypothetical protein